MRALLVPATLVAFAAACGSSPTSTGTTTAGTSGATTGASSTTGSGSAGTTQGSTSGATTSSGGTRTTTTGATSTSGATTGAASSTTSSTSSTSGGLTPLPIVPDQGGPLLTTVNVVTVSFTNAQLDLKGFADAILASTWFGEVGTEYGIQAGHRLGSYVFPDAGPTTVADAEIQAFLEGLIDAGAVPGPAVNTLYAIQYPPETSINLGQGAVSCQTIGGYHSYDSAVGFTYAVIANCPQSPGGPSPQTADQVAVTHEMLEAASDPLQSQPAYAFGFSSYAALPWTLSVNSEIGDLCVLAPYVTVDAGLYAQRIWSNAAADAGKDPCVPNPPGEIYYTVSPSLVGGGPGAPLVAVAQANAAQAQTFDFLLTGWATGAVPGGWGVAPMVAQSSFAVQASISNVAQGGFSPIGVGQTQTLSVTVPANTAAGNAAGISIYSGTPASFMNFNVAAVAVVVQ